MQFRKSVHFYNVTLCYDKYSHRDLKKTLLDKHQIRPVSDIYAHAINHVCHSTTENEDFKMLLRWFRDKSQTAALMVRLWYLSHTLYTHEMSTFIIAVI